MIDFKKYDSENPVIWQLFQRFTREAKAKGFKTYSSNGIFEIMRWHTAANGNDNFKVNNNFRPDYARKMMRAYPEFKGFLRVRKLTADRTVLAEVSVGENGQTRIC